MKSWNAKRNEARDVAVFPSLFKISKNHVFNMKDPIILGGRSSMAF